MSVPVQLNGPSISIHPPRVGWDWHQTARGSDPSISIHPPRVGWDLPTDSAECDLEISTHPPRVGWDSGSPSWRALLWYFNPPTPCGVGRKGRCWLKRPIATISIHPPRVGWDAAANGEGCEGYISIHPPRVGWDLRFCSSVIAGDRFQSTHPVWGGTDGCSHGSSGRAISIHPPRVGWDSTMRRTTSDEQDFNPPTPCGVGPAPGPFPSSMPIFQSTHPVWGGTCPPGCVCHPGPISIHPPRVGWDWSAVSSRARSMVFQSTHPVWGGTCRSAT